MKHYIYTLNHSSINHIYMYIIIDLHIILFKNKSMKQSKYVLNSKITYCFTFLPLEINHKNILCG